MNKHPFLLPFFITVFILLLFTLFFGVTFGIIFIFVNLITATLLLLTYQTVRKSGNRGLRNLHRAALILYGLFLISFAAIQILLVKEFNDTPTEDVGYVIILGAALKGEEVSKTLETRLDAGLRYLRENPDIPVIVSGGQGEGEDIPESTAMARYLAARGISKERIIEEDKSTTTWENLENSKVILESKGDAEEKIVIITSDYHMYRARQIGEKLGMDCYGVTGESDFFIKVNYMIREYFAVGKTMIFGKAAGA